MSIINVQFNVKKYGIEMFDKVLSELIRRKGPEGVQMCARLLNSVNLAVANSFEVAKMREPTKKEINRRIDLCAEICLRCLEKRYAISRIEDEVSRLLLEELGVVEKKKERSGSWGVKHQEIETMMLEEKI